MNHTQPSTALIAAMADLQEEATLSLVRQRLEAGGGLLTEEVNQYVGADHWTTDGIAGVELCRRLVDGVQG